MLQINNFQIHVPMGPANYSRELKNLSISNKYSGMLSSKYMIIVEFYGTVVTYFCIKRKTK